jgi:hypothetical protein
MFKLLQSYDLKKQILFALQFGPSKTQSVNLCMSHRWITNLYKRVMRPTVESDEQKASSAMVYRPLPRSRGGQDQPGHPHLEDLEAEEFQSPGEAGTPTSARGMAVVGRLRD